MKEVIVEELWHPQVPKPFIVTYFHDGSFKIETPSIPNAVHKKMDEIIKSIEQAIGGATTITKKTPTSSVNVNISQSGKDLA